MLLEESLERWFPPMFFSWILAIEALSLVFTECHPFSEAERLELGLCLLQVS